MTSRFFTIFAFLAILICVILSATAVPLSSHPELVARAGNNNNNNNGKFANNNDENVLLADAIPVASTGKGGNNIDLVPYNKNDQVPQAVINKGNKANGDGSGLKI
ncbi:hypothetical protein RclHR1_00530010 [Rhizophagus clarus]|nr:hypothetical protein RclHR1_00530010 [Rhizophagus clarus]